MANAQIGNPLGLAASNGTSILANITADGANTVTVDSIKNLAVGDTIDITTKSSGAVVASARTITGLTSAGVVTYSGADVTASTNEGVYPAGKYTAPRTNVNGGFSISHPFQQKQDTIPELRDRLTAIDSTFYSSQRLDTMTLNDMIYAVRVTDSLSTIKA